MTDRARVETRRDQPGGVGDIGEEVGADVVGDRPEAGEVDLATVGAGAGDDGAGSDLARFGGDRVVVEEAGGEIDAVEVGLEKPAGEVDGEAMRKGAR